jgi:anti-sigma factor RsiW
MGCPTQDGNAELLLDYSARNLSPEATAIFERHVQQCSECARFAASQQQLWEALDSWEPAPLSDDFDERLYARIDAEAQRPLWQSLWQRLLNDGWGWKPAAAAAMVTVALGAFLFVPQRTETPTQAPSRVEAGVHSDTIEPEQVERALEDLEMLRQLNVNTGAQTTPAL